MGPPKFQETDVTKGNGSRPSPLRITKDSHLIQKPTSPPISSSSASAAAAAAHQTLIENSSHASGAKHPAQSSSPPSSSSSSAAAKRQPVIIYTHSPKVIHAQARDFMALVQKLTGLTRSDDDKAESGKEDSSEDAGRLKNNNAAAAGSEDNDQSSYSPLTTSAEIKPDPSSAVSPIYKSSSPYLIDPPLFAANSSEFFCSSRSNPLFQTPTSMANSMSPALMEYMKGYPDY